MGIYCVGVYLIPIDRRRVDRLENRVLRNAGQFRRDAVDRERLADLVGCDQTGDERVGQWVQQAVKGARGETRVDEPGGTGKADH